MQAAWRSLMCMRNPKPESPCVPAGPPGPLPPLPPSPPPAPGREHHDLAAELVTLIGIGAIVSGAIAMAVLAIYTDSQRSQKRIQAWADGASTSLSYKRLKWHLYSQAGNSCRLALHLWTWPPTALYAP